MPEPLTGSRAGVGKPRQPARVGGWWTLKSGVPDFLQPAPPVPESMWPARLAIVVIAGLTLALGDHLTLGPPWLFPALEILLLLPLAAWRGQERRRLLRVGHHAMQWSQGLRGLILGLLLVLQLSTLISLVLLILGLLSGRNENGVNLLTGALVIWVTNVLVFSLWYWEVDQGGPLRRTGPGRPLDFLFPQHGNPDLTAPGWRPEYLDYLFLAFTNAAAFSPTDTLPLTRRGKALMTVQAAISMLTVVVVASRAVNILK